MERHSFGIDAGAPFEPEPPPAEPELWEEEVVGDAVGILPVRKTLVNAVFPHEASPTRMILTSSNGLRIEKTNSRQMSSGEMVYLRKSLRF